MMAISKSEIWIFKSLSSTQKVKGKESVVDCHLHLKPGSTMVNSRTTFTCFGLFRRVGKPEKPNRQARRSAASTILSYWADRAIRLCFDPEVNHLFHFCFWYIFSKGKQGNVEKYDLPFICIGITSILKSITSARFYLSINLNMNSTSL